MAQGEFSGDVNAASSQLGTFVSKKVGSAMLRIDHFRTVACKPSGDFPISSVQWTSCVPMDHFPRYLNKSSETN